MDVMKSFEKEFGREAISLADLVAKTTHEDTHSGARVILGLCRQAEEAAERRLAREGPWRDRPDEAGDEGLD